MTTQDDAAPRSAASRGPVDSGASTGPRPNVYGLDLSLTSTGVAAWGWCDRIVPGKLRGYDRLRHIRGKVLDLVTLGAADLVVIEGPAYNMSKGQGHHELAGLWWLVVYMLTEIRVPYAVASPQAVKTFATGKGNASKDAVLAAVVRRYPATPVTGNDEADAHILAALGYHHLGHPMVELPKTHLAALNKIVWPEVAR